MSSTWLVPECATTGMVPDDSVPMEDVVLVDASRRRGAVMRFVIGVARSVQWLFGLFSLLVGLALLASLPVLQLLSLGYLLEAGGRVARTGRLRDGFIGVRKAARVGGIVLGTWLLILPLRLLSDYWYAARLIDPDSRVTSGLRVALVILTALVLVHLVWAWFRGGRLRDFLWPAPVRLARRLRRGGKYAEARDGVWRFVTGLRLPHYFWLGLRGFAGAIAWLFVPIMLLIGASTLPPVAAAFSGILGAVMLAAVLLYLPFLQIQFAAENRLSAMFEVHEVRRLFLRAPFAFGFALFITLLFALPLYLLKIELTAREVAWLPSLVFVTFIYPSRLLTGWAVGRARRRETPRFFLSRWTSRTAAIPIVLFYVLIVFFTRYTSWYGAWSLFEQHAFLVPAPFLDF